MLKKLNKDSNEGFTIIEVMIVLAIAGLILLIVFLAIPALQRSQRNTSRKADASRLASAVSTFVSDNNNIMPGYVNGFNDAGTVISDAGKLGQLTILSAPTALDTAPTLHQLAIYTTANNWNTATPGANDNRAAIVEGATCNGALPAATTISNAAVLLYPTEQSGGYAWVCLTAH